MSINCKCGECPLDIRLLNWWTAKEDPAFEGTECLWHEVIPSSGGTRKTVKEAGINCIYVRASSICVSGGTPEEPVFALDNDGQMLEFGVKDLSYYAVQIGATKR